MRWSRAIPVALLGATLAFAGVLSAGCEPTEDQKPGTVACKEDKDGWRDCGR